MNIIPFGELFDDYGNLRPMHDADLRKRIEELHRQLDNDEIQPDPELATLLAMEIARLSVAILWNDDALDLVAYTAAHNLRYPRLGPTLNGTRSAKAWSSPRLIWPPCRKRFAPPEGSRSPVKPDEPTSPNAAPHSGVADGTRLAVSASDEPGRFHLLYD